TPAGACSSPVGCGALGSPNPWPAGTLHVSATLGQESARAYLRPDLSQVPAGATLESGRMTIPLDSAAQDGSLSPASATLRACLATAAFDDGVQGSLATAPAADCSVSTQVAVGGASLAVDLAP